MKTFIVYRHTGEDRKVLKEVLTPVKKVLEQRDIDVHCTFFDDESFKKKDISAKEILGHALSFIDKIDFLFVVQTSENKSESMLMEIGYCLAKKIPIVIAAKDNIKDSYLAQMADSAIKWKDITELTATIKTMDLDFVAQKSLKLYTDGGSRGNPGESAGAYIIRKMDDTVVRKSGFYLGTMTNNQAEYRALIRGLNEVSKLGVRNLNVFMDSELVVKQLNGNYKVKHSELLPLFDEAKRLLGNFEKTNVLHVPRALNKEADREVNRILDENARA